MSQRFHEASSWHLANEDSNDVNAQPSCSVLRRVALLQPAGLSKSSSANLSFVYWVITFWGVRLKSQNFGPRSEEGKMGETPIKRLVATRDPT